MNPVLPFVHLNGTSAQTLLDDALACRLALNEALKVLADRCPNSRDYYPHATQSAYNQAREHHAAIVRQLRGASDHYGLLAEHVLAAKDGELRIARRSRLDTELENRSACWFSHRTGDFTVERGQASPLTANEVTDLYARFPDADIGLRPAPAQTAGNEAPLPAAAAAGLGKTTR
jgi:hypothetical protein